MLSDISTIKSGQILTRISAEKTKEEVIGEQKVIIPKAISNGIIIKEQLSEIEISKQPDEDRLTKVGDIIIKLTTPYDSALITEDNEGLLVSSFCCIIRPDASSINPKFLLAFLNTSYIKDVLSTKSEGIGRIMIKLTDIGAIEIPVLDRKDMDSLGEAFILSSKKKKILSEMIETEEKIMENTIMKSVVEVL